MSLYEKQEHLMSVAKESNFRSRVSYYYFDEMCLSMQILTLCFLKYILHSSVSLHMMGISILSEQTLSQISKGDSLQDKGEHFVTFIIQTENNIHKRHKMAQLYFFFF